MHLIAGIPGGWNPNDEGVFHIKQSVGDIVFLSPADTEIALFNTVYQKILEENNTQDFPSLRLANLLYLKQELSVDTYIDEVLQFAKLIVCRLLGGKGYYPYLFEAISNLARERNIPLLLLPSYEFDGEVISASTVSELVVNKVWRYLEEGGGKNYKNAILYLFSNIFSISIDYEEVSLVPESFIYALDENKQVSQKEQDDLLLPNQFNVGIIVYRSHYLAENLSPVKSIYKKLRANSLNPILVFVHHLRDHDSEQILFNLLTNQGKRTIGLIINTTSFAIKNITESRKDNFLFEKIKAPVLQAILAGCTEELWKETASGLTPTDIAMNIAMPEMDGKIIGKAISFKNSLGKDPVTDSEILEYSAFEEGCDFMVSLAKNWLNLRNLNSGEKKIALIMPNYPNKDSRLANGVGLDTPASCVNILNALANAGYNLGKRFPKTSEEVITLISQVVTNDLDTINLRPYSIVLKEVDFDYHYSKFGQSLREKIENQWGDPKSSPNYTGTGFVIPGVILGNVFLSIQPSRGYNLDPKAIYHSPDLPPTPAYLAYYFWVNEVFKTHATVHVGKHGNLEWLPGKSVALSKASCFPSAIFGSTVHFYPFIVNDPGEGTQAKRRTQAVILDHLIPPMTRAETYGDLEKLEHLIEEYYEASNQDFKRVKAIKTSILSLVEKANLYKDLNLNPEDINEVLVGVDGYLCELKEAQIRGGLHLFGDAPKGDKLVDLLVALHRLPVYHASVPGITQAIAKDLKINFDPINCNYEEDAGITVNHVFCRTKGKVVEQLELIAKNIVSHLVTGRVGGDYTLTETMQVLGYITEETLPNIVNTKDEIFNLLKGLNGEYINSGPSGAPTSGKLDVLPTGRNFYSVDVRTVPSEISYQLGVKSANLIIDRYLQEHGDYPLSIGISVWGTSTMRTGGDDISQALSLMGVRPIWESKSRRVKDFEVIPLFQLNRPRVDVMLRISGFFRDAFPDIIRLFNTAVERVALLNEPLDQNPIRKRFLEEQSLWIEKGISQQVAYDRSLFRVFGSKPGAYGAGLQAVIDEKNWKDGKDLANIYVQWGGYAYTKNGKGQSAHESFAHRLTNLQIVMHNQDNREHDILDSDDYYQFQGGMANAVKILGGKAPAIYFGDHAKRAHPKVKSLKEELLKVYRSRVVNPKWIDAMKDHGYKGVFEMAATLDYLFAYDATTNLVDDFMYEGITDAYLRDEDLLKHIEEKNPWALKDMSERLLEAIQRGMWSSPSLETKEYLQNLYLKAEAIQEV